MTELNGMASQLVSQSSLREGYFDSSGGAGRVGKNKKGIVVDVDRGIYRIIGIYIGTKKV